MSNERENHSQPNTPPEMPLSTSIQQLFSRLRSSDVEQFINAYQLWTLHQQIDLLHLQIALTQQEIIANEELLHLTQPTPITLSSLAQLQSSGVTDIDLLDRMYARGESWLDNALQLLEHCERLDMIQGNYTQWCEHALEGAYDWLSSINEDDLSQAQPATIQTNNQAASMQEAAETDEHPESLLLQKLFSEHEEILPEESTLELAEKSHTSTAVTQTGPELFHKEDERFETPEEPNQSETPEELVQFEELEEPEAPTESLSSEAQPVSGFPEQNSPTFAEESGAEHFPQQLDSLQTDEQSNPIPPEAVEAEQETRTEDPAKKTTIDDPIREEVISNPTQIMGEDSSPNPPSSVADDPLLSDTPTRKDESQDTQNEDVQKESEDPEQTEDLGEQPKPLEEVQEETNPKRNSLMHRFVGRIFPKG